jgi:hypothetical protein
MQICQMAERAKKMAQVRQGKSRSSEENSLK